MSDLIQSVYLDGIWLSQTYLAGVPQPLKEMREVKELRWDSRKTEPTRRRRPTGWLYPTPYTMSQTSQRGCVGYLKTVTGSEANGTVMIGEGNFGQCWGSSVAVYPLPVEFEQPCIVKALSKLKDQKVNLGVALAEAQETADFIGSTASTVARAFRDITKGNWKRAVRGLTGKSDDIPKKWLEYEYAISPLLADVKGSFDALKQQPSYHWVTTVKASRKAPVARSEVQASGPSAYCNVRRVETGMQGCFVRLDYQPGNTFLSSLSSVGMTNPLEVIYERVPFSFILDWFLPVGDWLSAMDAAYGWQFLSGSCSFLTKTQVNFSSAGTSRPDIVRLYQLAGSGRTTYLSRKVYSTSPLPKFPGIQNPVSTKRMADGLSLLSQAMGRGRYRG